MSVATPQTDINVEPSTNAMPPRRATATAPRRLRIDIIGGSALGIAVAGLAGTLLLLRPLSVGSPSAAPVANPAVSASGVGEQRTVDRPIVRSDAHVADRWYENVAAAPVRSASVPAVRDQWYLPRSIVRRDAHVADRWYLDPTATPVRSAGSAARVADRWYEDAPAIRNAPRLSAQARDRWYMDK